VWLSEVNDWNPEVVIAKMPSQAFALIWTPDDTRLILRIWGVPQNTIEPQNETLAYNLKTNEVETWPWGQCDQLVKWVSAAEFAFVCKVYEGLENFEPGAIALKWGGEYQVIDSNDYEVLVSDLLNTFPEPFDWASVDGVEDIVYFKRNPDYQSGNQLIPFWEIDSIRETTPAVTVENTSDVERIISVSPNREQVAYSVRCDKDGETQFCLQISDLNTNQVIWQYRETFSTPTFFDIAWYPDNRAVAILGGGLEGHFIYVFDTIKGSTKQYEVGQTSGSIVID